MKKFLQIIAIAAIFSYVCTSCEKESEIGSINDLVGTYHVELTEDIVWGNSSGTTHDSGTVVITHLYDNKVKLSGFISTQGEVIDGYLYLENQTHSDIYGYTSTTYKKAIFGAGIITIWANVTGQLASNGVLYPFSSYCYFEGRKVK